MRVKHPKDSSYVQQYIQFRLDNFEVINIKQLSNEFEYTESALRTLLKKLDAGYAQISNYTIIKVGPGLRKLSDKIELE